MPLTIGNKTIHRISGPIFASLLKPNKTKFDQYNKKDLRLPLLLLMGDRHESQEFTCSQCGCDKPNNPCCFTINSSEFFKLFNTFSTKDHPISFNIEHFVRKVKGQLQSPEEIKRAQYRIQKDKDDNSFEAQLISEYAYEGSSFLGSTVKTTYPCFFHEHKQNTPEFYQEQCPGPNIIYNYVDARFAYVYNNERCIENTIYDCCDSLGKLLIKLQETLSRKDKQKYYIKKNNPHLSTEQIEEQYQHYLKIY